MKTKIRGNYGRLMFVSPVHQGKKQPYLYRLDFYVANFIDEQAIIGGKQFNHTRLRMVGYRIIEYLYEIDHYTRGSLLG